MTPHHSKTRFIGLLPIILALCMHSPLQADQIEIKGDKLSVEANRIPMRELMKQLSANYGITVRIDPAINPLITIAFKNRNLEDGLKAILKPHNHVFIWKAGVSGPTNATEGTFELKEIHVYRPGQKNRMISIDGSRQPPPPEPESEIEDETTAPSSQETPLIIKGNKVFIPVTLGYENNETETFLIFDTGAGSIVLHENVARQLGIEGGPASEGEGVGGFKIATRTTRLSYVQVGPHKKKNLRADIISYQGEADADYNGLLGMNFIRGLKYTIDFDAQVIKWNP